VARIRTVKPDLFRHEVLFDAEKESGLPLRLVFIGLFTVADREGRFKWKPRRIKPDVLPYDEDTCFDTCMHMLARAGFVTRYEVGGSEYGAINNWNKHQVVNSREKKSELPEPPENIGEHALHAQDTVTHGNAHGEGEGEGEHIDSVPKGTGAGAPQSLKEIVWQQGLKILKAHSDKPERQLRSMLGKWCRDKGESEVIAALDLAASKAEPIEYLHAALGPGGRKNGTNRKAGEDTETAEGQIQAIMQGHSAFRPGA